MRQPLICSCMDCPNPPTWVDFVRYRVNGATAYSFFPVCDAHHKTPGPGSTTTQSRRINEPYPPIKEDPYAVLLRHRCD